MNKRMSLKLAAAMVAALGVLASTPTLAGEAASTAAQVPGQKIDSGLGELPHYSQWADPTGKNPLRRTASAPASATPVAGEKKDSGLGDLPHYSQWADKTGRQAVQLAQAK
jgi:hypothetical protein